MGGSNRSVDANRLATLRFVALGPVVMIAAPDLAILAFTYGLKVSAPAIVTIAAPYLPGERFVPVRFTITTHAPPAVSSLHTVKALACNEPNRFCFKFPLIFCPYECLASRGINFADCSWRCREFLARM